MKIRDQHDIALQVPAGNCQLLAGVGNIWEQSLTGGPPRRRTPPTSHLENTGAIRRTDLSELLRIRSISRIYAPKGLRFRPRELRTPGLSADNPGVVSGAGYCI